MKEFGYEIKECNADNYSDFERLWNKFLNGYSVKSCLSSIKFSKIISKNVGFNKFLYDGEEYLSYFPFGVLYRIDDLDSNGIFYIGETTSQEGWSKGYLGTGGNKWKNYLKKYPSIDKEPNNPNAHHYKRTI